MYSPTTNSSQTNSSPTVTVSAYSNQLDSLSNTALQDIAIASAGGAFLLPAILPALGVPMGVTMASQATLGTTAAGIAVLYPQAFTNIESYFKSMSPTEILLLIAGAGALVIGSSIGIWGIQKHHSKKRK